MQVPAKRINGLLCAIFSLGVFGGMTLAQEGQITSGSGTIDSSASPAPAPSPGGAQANDAVALDYLFNRKPQDGSIAKQASLAQARMDDKAKAAEALGLTRLEDPQVRARFDRYLGTGEVSSETLAAYSVQLEKVQNLLMENQVFEAWKELRQLAAFDRIDAGVSLELANRIEAIWNTDKASTTIHSKNQDLKREVKTASWNADLISDSIREAELRWRQREAKTARKPERRQELQSSGDGPRNLNTEESSSEGSIVGLEGKLQLTEEYLRGLEAKAKIKLNELRLEKLLDSAKADFAAYINTLFGSHRHRHVILAADFYRKVFNESEYPVVIANQVNASLELAREVATSVEVFHYKLSRNELSGATDRIQEAFTASEFDPAVLAVPRRSKERIADFTSRLSRMQNLIEAHNFGSLATLIDEMRGAAVDFDSTKPLALVNAVKLESQLRLGKAKLAAQQGDLKLAMEEFQAAAEAWPGNPDLQDSAGTFFNTQDVKNQTLVEFDRLVEERNLRRIFDKQLAFAPAIHGAPQRETAFKEALEKIKAAEIAYEKSNLLSNAGNVYGAWETIEEAVVSLPNDIKLNMLRAELSGRGAEFVAMVNKAKEAEARKDYGYSLSCYAVAQRYYPASVLANAGIQRLAQQVLSRTGPL